MVEVEKNARYHKFPRNCIHIQHQRINLLNINAKVVVDYPAPTISSYTTAFLKNVVAFHLKHRRVFLKGGHLFKEGRHLFLLYVYAIKCMNFQRMSIVLFQ